jgi:hypothetical protein
MIVIEYFPDELQIIHDGNPTLFDLNNIIAVNCGFGLIRNPILFVINGNYEFVLVVAWFK